MQKRKATKSKTPSNPIRKKRVDIPKSEIRIDEIHNRFVIIAPKRGKRPHDIITEYDKRIRKPEESPFYLEAIKPSRPALHQVGPDDWWEIKVIENEYPFLHPKNPKAYGYQEVVIETPHPNKDLSEFGEPHILRLLQTYAARTKALAQDKKIKYILIFKNHGGKAGASLMHAHSQIMASGFVPPHIVGKLQRAEKYVVENGITYYAKLARDEARGPRRIYSDKHLVVFCPYASSYNYEAWVVPKRQVDNITQLEDPELKSLAHVLKVILKAVHKLRMPYNYYMHQTITDPSEYFYLRICPRRAVWAGVELGSRVIINAVAPEEAATFYRKNCKF